METALEGTTTSEALQLLSGIGAGDDKGNRIKVWPVAFFLKIIQKIHPKSPLVPKTAASLEGRPRIHVFVSIQG